MVASVEARSATVCLLVVAQARKSLIDQKSMLDFVGFASVAGASRFDTLCLLVSAQTAK